MFCSPLKGTLDTERGLAECGKSTKMPSIIIIVHDESTIPNFYQALLLYLCVCVYSFFAIQLYIVYTFITYFVSVPFVLYIV